jgi:hypothetical protein
MDVNKIASEFAGASIFTFNLLVPEMNLIRGFLLNIEII